jgi:predicted negative regulator of RcsB-dependent stress response
MKTRILIVFAVVALVVTFAYTASTPAAPNKANANALPAAAAQPNNSTAAAAESHPEIREAIASLRRAKEHMEHAAHDFGGHRVEAIRATDVAIRQLEDCLKYDKD